MKKLANEQLVFDNATFSNFARIEKLDLIFSVSENIYTTREVIEEIKRGIQKKPKLASILDCVKQHKITVETLKRAESIFLMDKIAQEGRLGIGEISSMVLAREMGAIFIADDERAVKKAETGGIRILIGNDLGLDINFKNRFKSTVIFLEILKTQKTISQKEFEEIKLLLEQENFLF